MFLCRYLLQKYIFTIGREVYLHFLINTKSLAPTTACSLHSTIIVESFVPSNPSFSEHRKYIKYEERFLMNFSELWRANAPLSGSKGEARRHECVADIVSYEKQLPLHTAARSSTPHSLFLDKPTFHYNTIRPNDMLKDRGQRMLVIFPLPSFHFCNYIHIFARNT